MERYIGKILKGRYQINEVVGIGGMAVVYKAFDLVLSRDVAVKILKDEYMRNSDFRRRFINESKAITLLTHENIVDIYDVSLDENDVMFIAMEYLDGVTLKEYVDSVGLLEWHEATHYIKQILNAAQHAHERGVVHRDIKPQNIMLLRDGTVKVMDFGIAKMSDFDTKTDSDETIGSVHYISPEQASGDELDERTDIYSIGIMMYQFCTGSLPFDNDSAVSVALMQIQDQPVLPRDLNDNIPIGLEQIILKAIMKNPFDRYVEASDMLRDIERIEENPNHQFHMDEYGDALIREPENKEPEMEFVPSDEPEMTKEEKKKLSTVLPMVCGVAAAFLFFVLIAAGMLFWPDVIAEKKYEVPNLIDKVLEDVLASDEYEHFKIVKKGEKPSEKAKGVILSQSVAEFSMVKDGTTIEVYVSSGVQKVCVPDIIGKSIEDAKRILNDSQIPFKTVELYSDSVASGRVINTSIPAGDEIDLSTDSIVVYVSKGSENNLVSVPNLSGKTSDEARTKLASIGLSLNSNITEEYSETVTKGLVISQSPAAGKSVNIGTSVRIVISKGTDPSVTPTDASLVVTIDFDETYTGQKMAISIKQDSTVLGAESVTYENLSNGSYVWNGSADADSTVTVAVDGVVQKTIVISSGLNTATIKMTGGSYKPEPDQPAELLPNFAGMTQQQAETEMAKYSISYEIQKEYSDTVAAGVVIRQTPAGDTAITEDMIVVLYISDGIDSAVQPPENQ